MSMSILAIIIAGLVFIGGLLVIYGDRKIPALSEAELRCITSWTCSCMSLVHGARLFASC
jgi:hypothetical protein